MSYYEEEPDSYEKKRRRIFKELAATIVKADCPCFEAIVAREAWNIQELAAANAYLDDKSKKSARLSLKTLYYVYVLLDPRKPGKFMYRIEDKTVTFNFQSFYVGKGIGKRVAKHVKVTRRKKRKGVDLTSKENTILSIEREELKVIEQVISTKSIEAVAFAKEILLIKAIGRKDLKKGPLTNLTDGGEGVVGVSKATRRKAVLKRKKTIESWTPEQHKNFGDSVSIGLRSRSSEEKQAAIDQKLATEAAWTPEQKQQKSDRLKVKGRARYDALPDGYNKWWWDSLTEEQQKQFGDRKSEDTKAFFASLTDEEYAAHLEQANIKRIATFASKTEEEKQATSAKQSASQTARHALRTEEEIRATVEKTNATKNAKSDEEKAKTTKQKKESAKAWYNSLTEDQKAEMKRKQDEAKANYPLRTCPHCGHQGKGGNMTRYHFDNCKYK